jgi:membrane-associated protease RseP (regulator of RpoE activity)
MLFLVIVQWFMILPHELGHAIAARLFGYTQIRILIGMGKILRAVSRFDTQPGEPCGVISLRESGCGRAAD